MERPAEKDCKDIKIEIKELKDSEDNTPEKKCEIHCNPVYGDLIATSAGIAAWIAKELNILELESAINLLTLINQIAILKQRYIDKKSGQIIE